MPKGQISRPHTRPHKKAVQARNKAGRTMRSYTDNKRKVPFDVKMSAWDDAREATKESRAAHKRAVNRAAGKSQKVREINSQLRKAAKAKAQPRRR